MSTDTRRNRLRVPPGVVHTHFLRCEICGNEQAGRGRSLLGARSGLSQHKQREHQIRPKAIRERKPLSDSGAKFTVFLECDICNNPVAGRGISASGARSSLAQHKNREHAPKNAIGDRIIPALARYFLDLRERAESW